jgi:LysR family transcriptional activator of glutamate synthase operon
MREYMALERGEIKLGLIPVIGKSGLAGLIADFHRNYPGIHLDFIEKNSMELIELLQRAEIDAAIIVEPPDIGDIMRTISIYPLIEDEIGLVTHEFHHFANKRSIKLAEVADEPFILLHKTSAVYSLIINACQEAGFFPKIVFSSTYLNTVVGLVVEGMGISLLASKEVSALPNIVYIPLETPIKHKTSLIVTNTSQSRPIKAFIKHCSEWFRHNLKGKNVHEY